MKKKEYNKGISICSEIIRNGKERSIINHKKLSLNQLYDLLDNKLNSSNEHYKTQTSIMSKNIEENEVTFDIDSKLKKTQSNKEEKQEKSPTRSKIKKSKKQRSWSKKMGGKNPKTANSYRNRLNTMSEVERFNLSFRYFKKRFKKISNKYDFSEYFMIDLLMMAIAKIIPRSYTKEYYHNTYLNHLKENLKKRYNLTINQCNRLDNMIDETFHSFLGKFNFSIFRCEMDDRFNIYLPLVYEHYKEEITNNITKFVKEFDYKQKIILWLFSYWISNIIPSLSSRTLIFIKDCATIAFSLTGINEEFIKDTIIEAGIGHFGDYYSLKRGNLHNLQENQGEYYYFWLENPFINEILEEVRIPDFSEEMHKFREKFDIVKNYRNVLEFIGLEYILKRDSNPNEFLDHIMISGSKRFLDHPKILKHGVVNIFIKEELSALITEMKNQVFLKYNWFIEALKSKYNTELDDINENGMIYYAELNGERYYIEIYPWYTEDILSNSNSNKIIVLLFHPKFSYLRENFYDPDLMDGLIAFNENSKAFSIGAASIHENLIQLFQEIENQGFKRISIEISPEDEINEDEEDEEIYFGENFLHITNNDGEGGNNNGFDNDFWDLFKWDAEKWERFEIDLNSDTPMCIFLKAKDRSFSAEKTVIKLISTEFKRKTGNLEASNEILDLSDYENSVITISSDKVADYSEILNQTNSKINQFSSTINESEYTDFVSELNDLMTQIDIVRGAKKKLVFFLCDSKSDIRELFIEVKKRITNTHLLELKCKKITDNDISEVMNGLCGILSIPSYNWETNLIPEDIDIDEAFTSLDEIKTLYYRKLSDHPNWIYIKPSWGNENEEHLKLKLLAYNYLKRAMKYQDDEIYIEEIFDPEGKDKAVPDITVNKEIWLEVETLLGNTDLSLLIQQKFERKKDLIKYFKEFWLVLPNFEIFMHKNKIRTFIKHLYNLFDKQVSIKIFGSDFIKKTLILRSQLKKSKN